MEGFVKPPKYRNKRTVIDGVSFDSKAEANRWLNLKLLERAGEITRLERQVRFPLVVDGVKVCSYIADFSYFTKEKRVVEDVKSPATASLPVFKIKSKLVKALYGIDVEIVK
jgi:hypothetical protein